MVLSKFVAKELTKERIEREEEDTFASYLLTSFIFLLSLLVVADDHHTPDNLHKVLQHTFSGQHVAVICIHNHCSIVLHSMGQPIGLHTRL